MASTLLDLFGSFAPSFWGSFWRPPMQGATASHWGLVAGLFLAPRFSHTNGAPKQGRTVRVHFGSATSEPKSGPTMGTAISANSAPPHP
jgi:hypothetical protein